MTMSAHGEPSNRASRRRFRPRFRLRTILILVTLFCVGAGWYLHGVRRQQQIVGLVREGQGLVGYDYERRGGGYDPAQRSWVPDRLLRSLGRDFFHAVVEVDFVSRPVDDPRPPHPQIEAALMSLNRLQQLDKLVLGGEQVTDANLAHVAKIRGLRELSLFDATRLTDVGIGHLASLQRLKRLHVDAPLITDASLAIVGQMPELVEVSLTSGKFSDAGLEELGKVRSIPRISIKGLDLNSSAAAD